MRKNIYDVYEGDKLILTEVTASEINDSLNLTIKNYVQSAINEQLIAGKYKVVIKEPAEDPFLRYDSEYREFAREWEKTCEPFRRLARIKENGCRLN